MGKILYSVQYKTPWLFWVSCLPNGIYHNALLDSLELQTYLSVGIVFAVRHCIHPRVGRRPRGLMASPGSHLLFIHFSVRYIFYFYESSISVCTQQYHKDFKYESLKRIYFF